MDVINLENTLNGLHTPLTMTYKDPNCFQLPSIADFIHTVSKNDTQATNHTLKETEVSRPYPKDARREWCKNASKIISKAHKLSPFIPKMNMRKK